ncbi:PREDICTED: CLAVATA3/ESR (CLE)-related protein 22-like [Camelina sativa]|uniref:CLAVATA3/ESR (CLE)-related protein 22-like n=1 Tax=Camelina sativa TaxID=90675 RepID=A0ABM0VAC4_CAMSA|nr:PREDICTED: CLAVATA3/ESR (CLE)-related protein 22-like [Camelina sativa]
MGNYYSRRKSRKHITTVALIILLLLLFLFLYAKASSSSSPNIHHHSTHGSLKKPEILDPELHDLDSNAASKGSLYTNKGGGEVVFEDGKRRVFTGPNPLHNR